MGEVLKEEIEVYNEESVPKRQRDLDLETKVHTENIRASPDWERLPSHFIVQVYRYLENSDRLAMAQVCKAWYTSFKDPSLWTTWEFSLGGPHGKHNGKNMIRFASMYGSSLQEVSIRFDHSASKSCKNITETMENLKLENAKLCNLELVNWEMCEFDKFPVLKDAICGCLIRLLQSQTALKNVIFWDSHFYYWFGTEVLKALQESSGQTLESLQLIRFFASDSDSRRLKLLPSHVEKFTNLRYIRINYSYIRDDVLQRLTVDLKDKLEYMTLEVKDKEDNAHVITSTAWSDLAKACPKLKVFLVINDCAHAMETLPSLVTGMPIGSLWIRSLMENDEDKMLATLLNYVADNLNEKLEFMALEFPSLRDSLDKEIIRVVEKCRKLTEMHVGLTDSAAIRVAVYLVNHLKELKLKNVLLEDGSRKEMFDPEGGKHIVITFDDMLKTTLNLAVKCSDD